MATNKSNEEMKRCIKCRKLKLLCSDFHKNKNTKDGFRNTCKECMKEYSKEYRKENKDKIKEYNKKYSKEYYKEYYKENQDKIKEYSKEYKKENKDKIKEYNKKYNKKYYEENQDKIKEYSKEYKKENKDKINEYNKKYYEENQDKIKEYSKEYSKEYRKENKDKIKEYNKEYKKENQDKIKEHDNEYRKERRKKDLKFKLSGSLRNRIAQGFNRFKDSGEKPRSKDCGDPVKRAIYYLSSIEPEDYSGEKYHIDHIIPICAWDLRKKFEYFCATHPKNLQWLTAKENLSKGGKYCISDKKKLEKELIAEFKKYKNNI